MIAGIVMDIKKVHHYSGVAVDSEDCLYIADYSGHQILKIREGKLLFALNQIFEP